MGQEGCSHMKRPAAPTEAALSMYHRLWGSSAVQHSTAHNAEHTAHHSIPPSSDWMPPPPLPPPPSHSPLVGPQMDAGKIHRGQLMVCDKVLARLGRPLCSSGEYTAGGTLLRMVCWDSLPPAACLLQPQPAAAPSPEAGAPGLSSRCESRAPQNPAAAQPAGIADKEARGRIGPACLPFCLHLPSRRPHPHPQSPQ